MYPLSTSAVALHLDESDSEIRIQSYSGRGMYGDRCLAITGPFTECINAMLSAVAEVDEDSEREALAYSLRSPSMDSMGLDVVLYWPRLTANDAELAEYEGGDDDDDA